MQKQNLKSMGLRCSASVGGEEVVLGHQGTCGGKLCGGSSLCPPSRGLRTVRLYLRQQSLT